MLTFSCISIASGNVHNVFFRHYYDGDVCFLWNGAHGKLSFVLYYSSQWMSKLWQDHSRSTGERTYGFTWPLQTYSWSVEVALSLFYIELYFLITYYYYHYVWYIIYYYYNAITVLCFLLWLLIYEACTYKPVALSYTYLRLDPPVSVTPHVEVC